MTKHTELTDVLPNQHGDTKLVIDLIAGNNITQWRCVKMLDGKAWQPTRGDEIYPIGDRGRPDIIGIAENAAATGEAVTVCIYGKTKATYKQAMLSGYVLESRADGKVGSFVSGDLECKSAGLHYHWLAYGPPEESEKTESAGPHTHGVEFNAHYAISGAFLGLVIEAGAADYVGDIILMRG